MDKDNISAIFDGIVGVIIAIGIVKWLFFQEDIMDKKNVEIIMTGIVVSLIVVGIFSVILYTLYLASKSGGI